MGQIQKILLAKEKAHSRARDELTSARQALPWRKVAKEYRFQAADGEVSLGDLFGNKSQLLIQHFMFGPEWEAGCKSCSMMADHINPSIPHLAARDVRLAAISRAPLDKLQAYHQRMGWDFAWVSSLGSDFNVSFTEAAMEAGEVNYNFGKGGRFPDGEAPGLSSFVKDSDGTIYHAYSVYARGLEAAMGIYDLLDLVPKGRDEDALGYSQAWFKHHDEYDD
jgi:predicted dithiol-disulfide oxidoreductase (DUF899 family)